MAESVQARAENLATYVCLFIIENVLRELIIEVLTQVDGPKWYKHRLPGDLLEKYRGAVAEARRVKWTRLVPHHPVYYLDFADLKKIICRDDNWEQGFSKRLGRKDLFSATLSDLEPLRNTTAHNRLNSELDVDISRTALKQLTNALGGDFDRLARTWTTANDIAEKIRELSLEAEDALYSCRTFKRISGLPAWGSIRSEWWFDESYLGRDVGAIAKYFAAVEAYSLLPRVRGKGYLLEAWLRETNIGGLHDDASKTMSLLLQEAK